MYALGRRSQAAPLQKHQRDLSRQRGLRSLAKFGPAGSRLPYPSMHAMLNTIPKRLQQASHSAALGKMNEAKSILERI